MVRKASASLLNGFELDSDVEIVRHPKTFVPEDTEEIWSLLTELRRKICFDTCETPGEKRQELR